MPGASLAVAGNTVIGYHTVLDANFAPKTGMLVPTDVTLTLHRQSGATVIAAGLSITWTEIGVTGRYFFTFVPTVAGKYFMDLQELHPLSLLRHVPFEWDVVTAGSAYAPTYANAFCAEADIERFTGLAIDATSKPSASEVAGFAQGRASEMRGVLGAEGWEPVPGAVSGIEADMLRECNAVGAAADTWLAKYRDTEPEETKAGAEFLEEYETRLNRLVAYTEKGKAAGSGAGIGSPMVDGEVTLRDEGNVEDTGLRDAIRMDNGWP